MSGPGQRSGGGRTGAGGGREDPGRTVELALRTGGLMQWSGVGRTGAGSDCSSGRPASLTIARSRTSLIRCHVLSNVHLGGR